MLCHELQLQLQLLQQERHAEHRNDADGSDTIKACHIQQGGTNEGSKAAPRTIHLGPPGLQAVSDSPMMAFSVDTRSLKGLDLRLDFG